MKTAVSLQQGDEESDIRDAARIAARRDGLSLGDWLDNVMTKRAKSLGLDLSDLAPDQRVHAVMRGLGWTGEADEAVAGAPHGPEPQASEPVAMEAPVAAPQAAEPAPEPEPAGAPSVIDLRSSDHAGIVIAAGPGNTDAEPPREVAAPLPAEPVSPVALKPDADRAASAVSRQAAQRVEIETKLNALFKALDRPARRETSAIDAMDPPGTDARVQTLLGETAISPSWRLEKAVSEIAQRQAFLDRQAAPEAAPPVAQQRRRTDAPRAPSSEAPPARAVKEEVLARPDAVRPRRAAEPSASIFTSLQGDIARLAKRLEAVHQDMARRPQPNRTAVNEIRALLDDMRPDASIDTLGKHVEALSQKLDTVIEHRVPADAINRLSQRIEDVHAEMAARLAEQAATPQIDLRTIEQMIREVVENAERPGPAMPDLGGLEQAVHDLGQQLERAERSQVDGSVLAELQAQVGTLAARIDRSDAGLTAIVAMERSLGDIFVQVGEMRDAAVQAAESAGRVAAEDTVKAALAEAALTPQPRSGGGHAAVEQVSQDLAEFRVAREEADKRLHTILGALNTSLERVVDRLGALEEDAAEGLIRAKGVASVASVAVPRSAPAPAPVPVAPVEASAPEAPAIAPVAAPVAEAPEVAAPQVRPVTKAEPVDLDMPIEPGSGAPRQRFEGTPAEVSPAAPDPTSFIAAARRAAQNAALDQAKRPESPAKGRRSRLAPPSTALAAPEHVKAGLGSGRRPLLLALASLVLLMGAAQIVRLSLNSGTDTAAPETVAATEPTAPAPDGAKVAADKTAAAAPAEAAPAAAPAPVATSAAAAPPAADVVATDAVVPPAKADPAPPKLPSLAMGPAANLAAAQIAENAAKIAPVEMLPAGLREMAQSGRADAQYEVGLRYADGRGVTRDLKTAASWFEKAAKQGLAPAAYRLGSLYERGLGAPRDAAQAIGWYQKAADAGNVRAMHNLAVLLAEGATGKADYPTAASWFTKAAEAGVKDSQFNLAILYARGLGLDQNLGQAYTWFSIVAAQGDADSAKKRDDIAPRLDAAALDAAKKAAEDFKPTTPSPVANDVPVPPGGWDAVAPASRPVAPSPKPAHISSM